MKISACVINDLLWENSDEWTVKVSGNSMFPSLIDGQIVRLKSINLPLQNGNIYAFKTKKRISIHRLIFVFGDKAYFIGDASGSIDIIKPHDIIGLLINKENELKKCSLTLINIIFCTFNYKIIRIIKQIICHFFKHIE